MCTWYKGYRSAILGTDDAKVGGRRPFVLFQPVTLTPFQTTRRRWFTAKVAKNFHVIDLLVQNIGIHQES
jgi:hypothetical protein